MAKYRALLDLALRKSPDPSSPLYAEWFTWKAGATFEAPPHMKADVMLAAGKIESVRGGQ